MKTAFLSLLCLTPTIAQPYWDRWNYFETRENRRGFTDYGPEEWGRIDCDERNDLDECIGYRDKWHEGQEWEIERNYCRWCPIEEAEENPCGRHHMSPTNLDRDVGVPGDPAEKECIDVHWMKYEDSFCTLEHLEEANAFTIERHALRISNPVIFHGNDILESGCFQPGRGRRFGRIDYSKGFSQWWYLSHIDVHVPSEHAQENTKYDGEMQLHHWYSVNATFAGVDNELGTVAVFLQVYDDAPPYPYLDKVICQWRRYEYETRKACTEAGLGDRFDEISAPTYPGCFPLDDDRRKKRNLRNDKESGKPHKRKVRRLQDETPFNTIQEVLIHNAMIDPKDKNATRYKIKMDPVNFEPAEDKDWDKFIQEQSDLMKFQDRAYYRAKDEDKHKFVHDNETLWQDLEDHERRLIAGAEIEWFNYFPMLGVRTEYYYRYSGSQTIPPCYGNFVSNSRKGTNHWRVLKDPIRIHKRQLEELKRLIKERVAPLGDPVAQCRPDTAARVRSNGDVIAARPLQYFHQAHFKVFCECKDWPSKWPEDRDWCDIEDVNERFYDHPYNFETSGF